MKKIFVLSALLIAFSSPMFAWAYAHGPKFIEENAAAELRLVEPDIPLIRVAEGCDIPLNLEEPPPISFEQKLIQAWDLRELREKIIDNIRLGWSVEAKMINTQALNGYIQVMIRPAK